MPINIFIMKTLIKRIHLPLLILPLLLLDFATLSAQEAITASGGEASGSGGSVSYSTGQTFYHAYSDTALQMIEGVQQPYEISIVTNIGSRLSESIDLMIFPNPTSGQLVLKVDGHYLSGLNYLMVNNQGEVIGKGTLSEAETTFRLVSQPNGIYFLSVFKDDIKQKVFKIIKQ